MIMIIFLWMVDNGLICRWSRWRMRSARQLKEKGLRWEKSVIERRSHLPLICFRAQFFLFTLSWCFSTDFSILLSLLLLACGQFHSLGPTDFSLPGTLKPSRLGGLVFKPRFSSLSHTKPFQPGSPGQGGGNSKYSRLPSTADSPHRWPSSRWGSYWCQDRWILDWPGQWFSGLFQNHWFQGGFHCEPGAAAGGDEEAGRDNGGDGGQHGQHQGHEPSHCQWTWRTGSVSISDPSHFLRVVLHITHTVIVSGMLSFKKCNRAMDIVRDPFSLPPPSTDLNESKRTSLAKKHSSSTECWMSLGLKSSTLTQGWTPHWEKWPKCFTYLMVISTGFTGFGILLLISDV